jgi:hypothetical protein
MTVIELIRELSKYPSDMEVVFGEDEWMEIDSVKQDDNGGIQKPVVVIE